MENTPVHSQSNAMARATGGVLLAGAILFLLARSDTGSGARTALLLVLGAALATLSGSHEVSAERTSWHEYEGALRGI